MDLQADYDSAEGGLSNGNPRVDKYGFEHSEDFDHESYEEIMSEYLPVLARRSEKWSKLLQENSKVDKNLKVKRYVRKGVPSKHRTLIWMVASGAQQHLQMNSGYYHSLLKAPHDPTLEEAIRTDLHRTFPDNIQFHDSSQHCLLKALYNVLLAYGHHNKDVGYCQGMNFIAGYLLIITKDEEKAFWLMDALLGRILPGPGFTFLTRTVVPDEWTTMAQQNTHYEIMSLIPEHTNMSGMSDTRVHILRLKFRCSQNRGTFLTMEARDTQVDENGQRMNGDVPQLLPPDYYTPAMLGLKTDQDVLGQLVKAKVPAVWRSMAQHNVVWGLVVSKWFICLYIDVLPMETVLRIWDCLFYEGSKILFRVALTLIRHHQELILQARNFSDVCERFKKITHGEFVENCHAFMQSIFTEPGNLSMATITKLREICRERIQAQDSGR